MSREAMISALDALLVYDNREAAITALRAALAESDQSDEVQSLREANERFGKRQEWWTERMFQLEQELDKARAALAEATIAEKLEPWKEAVIEGLVVSHIYRNEHETEPRKALNDLICNHIAIALDPQVSSDAQALIDRGRKEAQADAEPCGYVFIDWQGKVGHALWPTEFIAKEVAKDSGHSVAAAYLHPPRRESAELSKYIDAFLVAVLAEDCYSRHELMTMARELSAVLRAAGGEG